MNHTHSLLAPSGPVPQPPPTQSPNLYLAVSTIRHGGRISDVYETHFGIRDVRFDAAQGLVDDLVDAALVGFDRREPVTIPPLGDAQVWAALEGARAVLPMSLGGAPAERYRDAA